jgi:hypothetical protein
MTIFDSLRYPITSIRHHEELKDLPDKLLEDWWLSLFNQLPATMPGSTPKSAIITQCRNWTYPDYDKREAKKETRYTELLRKKILEWEGDSQ